MRTGVSTASLFLRELNENALTVLNDLGVDCTEIFLTTFSEYTPEFARLLKERVGNLFVNSVHVVNTQFEPQLFSGHPRARTDAFSLLEQVSESAGIFGARAYTFHGITRLKKSFAGLDFPRMGKNLQEIAEVCARRNIRLCLENVHWATYANPGEFTELRKYAPDLWGVFDIKQARLAGYPYPMYLKDMQGRISHVHLSDVDERGRICRPGKGVTDFTEVLLRLRDAGFNGVALIEVYKNDYGAYRELKESCDYLQEILDKIGC